MLNPITYTEKTISDFLCYQITTDPFVDLQVKMLWELQFPKQP